MGLSWVIGMLVVTTPDFRRGPRKGLRITSPMRLTSPKPDKQQKRRMQHLVVHHRMNACGIAQIAHMLGQHAAQKREAQVGAHGLRAGDPVVAGCALHRLVALVDDHGNGVVVVGCDGRAGCVVAVVGPVGAGRQAHGIDAQEIERGFDIGGVVFGCVLYRIAHRLTVL